MNIDDEAKKAVQLLGEAINSAIEKSPRVLTAIEKLRSVGYEPNLRLDIRLLELAKRPISDESQEVELNLTDEDLKTLHRMKIKLWIVVGGWWSVVR